MLPSSITALRNATKADLDAIADVWWESSRSADGAPADHPGVEQLRERIDDEVARDWRLTVAVQNGRIVGFLALKPQVAILDQLFVLPAAQRSGIGRALLDRAKAELAAGFTLRTLADNRAARRFYEHQGLTLALEGKHPRLGYPVCFYRWPGLDVHHSPMRMGGAP